MISWQLHKSQIEEEHRLKAIIEELLVYNTSSNVQNLILLFNKYIKATQSFDMPYILHNGTFITESKTIAKPFSVISKNDKIFLNDTVSKVVYVTNSVKSISLIYLRISKPLSSIRFRAVME